jgi:hypothetical protein
MKSKMQLPGREDTHGITADVLEVHAIPYHRQMTLKGIATGSGH